MHDEQSLNVTNHVQRFWDWRCYVKFHRQSQLSIDLKIDNKNKVTQSFSVFLFFITELTFSLGNVPEPPSHPPSSAVVDRKLSKNEEDFLLVVNKRKNQKINWSLSGEISTWVA